VGASQTTIHSNGAGDLTAQIKSIVYSVTAKAMVDQVPKVAAEVAQNEIVKADDERQHLEDMRANKRNRNRTYTIMVALLMTFAVPYAVGNILHAPEVLRYSTGIAIFPDFLITMFAWWKHY
jgi:hypothetical protein